MLIVNSICGNVYQNNRLADKLELAKSNGTLRRLLLSRIEMEMARLRKETEDGVEVGLEFESGTKIHHGDIVSENLEFIMVEQEPEKVITIKFKGYGSSDLFLFIGHTIGNSQNQSLYKLMEVSHFQSMMIQSLTCSKNCFMKLYTSWNL